MEPPAPPARAAPGHACGAGEFAPRLGHLLRHRRRRLRTGDCNQAVSVGHRPHLEGNRLWGLQEQNRRTRARGGASARGAAARTVRHASVSADVWRFSRGHKERRLTGLDTLRIPVGWGGRGE
eukprot:scaffold6012_cov106-Isochrysis_galbana.AAC.2